MPKRRSIKTSNPSDFEPKRKNPISLGSDSNIDNDLKSLKIADNNTGIELSKNNISITKPVNSYEQEIEKLTTYKILGTRDRKTDHPNLMFQHPEADDPTYGLYFNFKDTGQCFIRSVGDDLYLTSEVDMHLTVGDENIFAIANGTLSSSNTFLAIDPDAENLTLYPQASGADYFRINVTTDGFTTLSTHHNAGLDGKLIIKADGELKLMPENGDLTMYIGADKWAHMWTSSSTGNVLRLYERHSGGTSTDDRFTIACQEHGETTIYTEDAASNNANLTLDIDGKIIIDSARGNIDYYNNGTRFTQAGSAYAGCILGYTHLTTTGGIESYTLTTSYAVVDADAKVTFTAPPSGNVEIEFQVWRDSSTSLETVYFALSDNATHNAASAEIGDGSTAYELVQGYGSDKADETDDRYVTGKFVVGGLTANTSYTYWISAFATSGTTYLKWGGTTATSPDRYYPPFVIKATALPANIHTQ